MSIYIALTGRVTGTKHERYERAYLLVGHKDMHKAIDAFEDYLDRKDYDKDEIHEIVKGCLFYTVEGDMEIIS